MVSAATNAMTPSTPATDAAAQAFDEQLALAPWRVARAKLKRHRGAQIGAGLVLLLVLLAVAAPLLAGHDPYEQDLTRRLLPPVWDAVRGTWEHPLGTDHLGRDYASRLLYGARISLTIGLTAAAIGMLIGTVLGVAAGFFGGTVDRIANYLLTCQLALPGLLLAMALVFLIGPSTTVVIVVIGLLHWTYFLVVSRAATQQLRNLEFVAAARAAGASRLQLLWHEVLPNLRSQIIVVFTMEVGMAIVAEASLSFLGVGVPSPTPSWGLMIAEGRNFMFLRPELVLLPGCALFLLVVGINLLGDGLRDVTATGGRS